MRTKASALRSVSVAAGVALSLALVWAGPARAGETVSDRVVNSLLLQGEKIQQPLALKPSRSAEATGLKGEGPRGSERESFGPLGKLKGLGIGGLILGGVVLLAFGAWKHGWRLKRGSSYGSHIRLVSTRALGDKKAIAVVEVEGQRLVVGMTPQQVTLLTTLPPGDEEPKELFERRPARRSSGEPAWSQSRADYDFGQRSYPDIQGIFAAMRG